MSMPKTLSVCLGLLAAAAASSALAGDWKLCELQVQLREQQTSRKELGREEFLKRVWAWKAESGGTITRQLRRLGASCDWSRERFTLDSGLSGGWGRCSLMGWGCA